MSQIFSPQEVAMAIGIPVSEWPGCCYSIACAMVTAGLTDAEPVYGSWLGPVDKQGHFGKNQSGDVNHGWLVADTHLNRGRQPKTIIDPTRWVFENVKPYIYVGDNDYYDRASQMRARVLFGMKPSPDPSPRTITLDWPYPEVMEHALELLQEPTDMEICDFSVAQVHYLATAPVMRLQPYAEEILCAIRNAGNDVFIPTDIQQWVLRNPPAGFKEWPYKPVQEVGDGRKRLTGVS